MVERGPARRTFLDSAARPGGGTRDPPLDNLGESMGAPQVKMAPSSSRLRTLQTVGILSGFAAGAWLGGAEAPTKLVNIGISPMVVSLAIVTGGVLGRWTLA